MGVVSRDVPAVVEYCQGDYGATTMSTSTNVSSAESLNPNVMLDAVTGLRAMEYSIETCDTDMLTKSYHRLADDDDIELLQRQLADADRICAVDVVAGVPVDLPRDSPSS